jgi:hypothetical protein
MSDITNYASDQSGGVRDWSLHALKNSRRYKHDPGGCAFFRPSVYRNAACLWK